MRTSGSEGGPGKQISAGFGIRRGGSGKGAFLEAKVGVEVNVGCPGLLVAEPEGDDRLVDPGAQKFHGAAVPQGVRRHVLRAERRTLLHGSGDVALDETSDGVACQGCSSGPGKERVGRFTWVLPEPCCDDGRCLTSERGRAFLAAFASAAKVGSVPRVMSWRRSAVSSETRRPVWRATTRRVWSRRPTQLERSGAASSASVSARVRNETKARS